MEWDVRERLFSLAEPEFRDFSAALIPNSRPLIGVRLPRLRELAKEIAKGDFRSYLKDASDEFMEEVTLQGMVIGYAKLELEERLQWIAWFVPKIDSWAICDSFCNTLKFAQKNREAVWEFLQPYFAGKNEFGVRFAVVMALCHYVLPEYAERCFSNFNAITQEGYYVKMAVAWAVSVFYVKLPEQTMPYLKENRLDDWTYNKALQKILESRRIAGEERELIRSMKRK